MEEKVDYSRLAVTALTDDRAFSQLYEYYFPRAYNFIFARTGNRDVADEVISIAFEKAFLRLDLYDPSKGAFSTWLFRIVSNVMTDYFRRKNVRHEVAWMDTLDTFFAENGSPEDNVLHKEECSVLYTALEKLKPRDKNVLMLKYWQGLSNQEIAEMVGVTAGNVSVIIHRAIAELRGCMKKEI